MKLCFISDTHLFHPELEDSDVLFHCGDLTKSGTERELIAENLWLESIRHKFKEIYYIPGNHDFLFEKNFNLAKSFFPKINVLMNEYAQFQDLKIFGCSLVPECGNWAFSRSFNQRKKFWSNISESADILITHAPAYGRFDRLYFNGQNVGCQLISGYLQQHKPKIHAHGHLHENWGHFYNEEEDRHFINCTIMDVNYKPRNKPVYIELK